MSDQDNDMDVFDDQGDESTESGEQAAPPEAPDSGSDKDSKRVDDLMSKWQKAEERARRAEEQLKARKQDSDSAGERKRDSGSPETDAWISVAREYTVDQIFRSDPRFERYGIERSQLTGKTPDELRASAEALTKLVDALETRIRNDALLEHGITPDSAGGGASTRIGNVGAMPKDEFEKLVADAKAGKFSR